MRTWAKRSRILALASAILLLIAIVLTAASQQVYAQSSGWPKSLKGQLLVAEPSLGDPNFTRTVVFMIAHDEQGAFGVVVNRSYGDMPLARLMSGFGMEESPPTKKVEVFYGGPVGPGQGLVVHSNEYAIAGTRSVTEKLSFTTNVEILRDIAGGRGPRKSLFVMGYAGWSPGQLESEIARGDWFWIPADSDLVLDEPHHRKWKAAMDRRGMDL